MSTIFSNLKGLMSPSKPSSVNGDNHLNNEEKMSRGQKRKADPYDVVADEEDDTPQPSSSTGKQRVRSRVSTDAPLRPAPKRVPRLSVAADRWASLLDPGATQRGYCGGGKAKASKVPVADMGGEELLQNNGDAPTVSDKPTDNDAENMIQTALEKREFANTAEDGETEIDKLLKHRRLNDGSVEILVKWVDEPEEDATKSNRRTVPPGKTETYHVFKILRHEKKKTIFQFEVQWVGYPATPGNTSFEPETKLKNICPELLKEYWASKGGREAHLARRGRAKKARTE
ncbi:hypothetical protein PG994_005689 [Apiospora phragmitis]|uniref:Chromo domain-containing protein n=1 Tax=Apiospora phragmitis TaxID=2905665 RepID=A0ABR1VCY4_9PEZI